MSGNSGQSGHQEIIYQRSWQVPQHNVLFLSDTFIFLQLLQSHCFFTVFLLAWPCLPGHAGPLVTGSSGAGADRPAASALGLAIIGPLGMLLVLERFVVGVSKY